MTAKGTSPLEVALTSWLRKPENALFLVLIAAYLVPIWISPAFLTQDGPAHVADARGLLDYNDPDLPILRAFYFFNAQLLPNWIGHLTLAAFSLLFPPLIAEKLLVSSFTILLPVSARYACRAFGDDRGFLALLVFPFIFNLLLNLGFYNFCSSMIQFFFVLGYWCRHQHDFRLEHAVPFTGLTLLLYFSHGFGTMATCLIFFATVGWMTLVKLYERLPDGRLAALRAAALRPLGATLYACVPLFLLGTYVLITREVGGTAGTHYGFGKLAVWLLRTEVLVVHDLSMAPYTSGVSAVFALAIAFTLFGKVTLKSWHRWDGLLLVTLFALVVYFLLPGQFINKWANHRFMPFVFYTALLWLAAQPPHRVMRAGVMIGSVVLSLPVLGFQTLHRLELAEYLDEFLSVSEQIQPNSSILPLIFSSGRVKDGERISANTRPFLHAAGYLAAQRGAVEFTNYEGTSGVFPLSFHPEVDPYKHLGARIEWLPSCLEIAGYERETGMTADYILWWNPLRSMDRDPCMAKLKEQVAASYTLRFQSSGHGLARLYERTRRRPLPETRWEVSDALSPDSRLKPESVSRWRPLPIAAVGGQGVLDLNRIVPFAREGRCLYLRQVMDMKEAVAADLRSDSGDPYAIWLNEQLIQVERQPPKFQLDRTIVPAEFQPGLNTMYVKACSVDRDWKLAVRLTAEVIAQRTLVR